MRKLRDVLRLTAAGMSSRQVAASLTVGATTVIDYLARARRAGIAWPLPDDLTDEALEASLYPPPPTVAKDQRPLPDWPTVHRELKRPGVTLQLLWEEYRGRQPQGYGYSRFCELYRAWAKRLSPTMRQTHVAGERLFTARTVEVFHRGKRVAAHVRSSSNRRHTTVREHMPSSHRRYADWTPESLKRRAGEIGRSTSALVEIILRERPHPEQGFRACAGILRFARTYGAERLEAACARASQIGARSYSSVKSILKNDLDRRQPEPATDGPAIVHVNIRGPTYFH